MNKRERIQAVIAGKEIDRVPVGFWRHWPGDDQRPDTLAAVTLDYQRRFDLDFIKFPVSSVYCVDDYGIEHAYQGNSNGDREYLSRIIFTPEDWLKIKPLDINQGTYGWHLESLKQVLAERDTDTPVIVTMFNPMAMAAYLAGDELLLAHIRQYPEKVMLALKALAETSARFINACIKLGADGVFLSTRFASYEMVTEQEYLSFGRSGDLKVLQAAAEGWFNVLHLHGQHPMMKLLADYPVQAINWHDVTSDIDLAVASRIFPGVLMGGVEQSQTLLNGTPEAVSDQSSSAISRLDGRRLILTPGCTYSLGVPESNLLALRHSVDI
ncbi:MAG: uroporphyrinogen decarboxylase family protein [Dehalogenimonas sp.]